MTSNAVILKPELPTPSWPPKERESFVATPLQQFLIREHLRKGYGAEGTERIHKRLYEKFKDSNGEPRIHPGMSMELEPDDENNIQRDANGEVVLVERNTYDRNCQYIENGVRFQIPCSLEPQCRGRGDRIDGRIDLTAEEADSTRIRRD